MKILGPTLTLSTAFLFQNGARDDPTCLLLRPPRLPILHGWNFKAGLKWKRRQAGFGEEAAGFEMAPCTVLRVYESLFVSCSRMVFGHFWGQFRTLGHFGTFLNLFGHFWTFLNIFGHFQKLSDFFGHFRTLSDRFGHFRTLSDNFGHFQIFSDTFGHLFDTPQM